MSDLCVICGFTGVICEKLPSYYLDEYGQMKHYVSTKPIYSTIRMLIGFKKSGCDIVIVDHNGAKFKKQMSNWLSEHGVQFDHFVCPQQPDIYESEALVKQRIINDAINDGIIGKIFCCIERDQHVCRLLAAFKDRPYIYQLSRREL